MFRKAFSGLITTFVRDLPTNVVPRKISPRAGYDLIRRNASENKNIDLTLKAPETPVQEAVKQEGMDNGSLPRPEVPSKTPVQEALLRQQLGVNNLVDQTTGASSLGIQKSIRYAYTRVFGKEPSVEAFYTTREFSTSSDQWLPKSIVDLLPLKEVYEEFQVRKIEQWKRIANKTLGRNLTDKEHEEFIDQIKQKAKKLVKDARICKRVDANNLNRFLVDGYIVSGFEVNRSIGLHTVASLRETMAHVQQGLYGCYRKDLPVHLDFSQWNYLFPLVNLFYKEDVS